MIRVSGNSSVHLTVGHITQTSLYIDLVNIVFTFLCAVYSPVRFSQMWGIP